jgi:hypothetical protein
MFKASETDVPNQLDEICRYRVNGEALAMRVSFRGVISGDSDPLGPTPKTLLTCSYITRWRNGDSHGPPDVPGRSSVPKAMSTNCGPDRYNVLV